MTNLDSALDKREAGTPDKHEARGSRRLAAAVMVQAVSDLHGGTMTNHRSAMEWFKLGDVGVLSFRACCEILGRDADIVRTNLLTDYGVPRAFLKFGPLTERPARTT